MDSCIICKFLSGRPGKMFANFLSLSNFPVEHLKASDFLGNKKAVCHEK